MDQWIEVVFSKEAGQELVWKTIKIPPEKKSEIDKVCDQGSKLEGF